MTDAPSIVSTRTSGIIKAPREALYEAFLDPAALTVWLPPGEMTGKVHYFRPEDNEAGCRSSLEKLARYVGARSKREWDR